MWVNCDRCRGIWYFKKKEKELPTFEIFKIFFVHTQYTNSVSVALLLTE